MDSLFPDLINNYFILYLTVVISLLILTCVLAACVTFTSISLLVVYPETLQSNVQQILPNNTILAVPEGGLNPTIINYVTYRYYKNQLRLRVVGHVVAKEKNPFSTWVA